MEKTDTPCSWSIGTEEESPHSHFRPERNPKILNNILEQIGNTPIVRINKIGKEAGLKCELLAKCEYFNAGGSIKDRIGHRMVMDAENSGRINPGDTLIEPTSGNTGIGLSLAAAVGGYEMVITLPEKMSQEKFNTMAALGAKIYRTPTEAAFDDPESHIGIANKLNSEIPNSHILDQYSNPSNPLAHYDGTAEEIIEQCDGKLDMIVMGAGTGGTLTGIAKKIKEKLPNVEIVGVDPIGSILAQPAELNEGGAGTYQVEGIGYDFIPRVLDRSVCDRWIKTSDKESFLMARKLIRDEGLLCGGSSGTAMVAALRAAADLEEGQRCLVILPDSVKNYMTKFLSDDWMWEHGFTEEETATAGEKWFNEPLSNLELVETVAIPDTETVGNAIEAIKESNDKPIPVVDGDGAVVGAVTTKNLVSSLVHNLNAKDEEISGHMTKDFAKVLPTTTFGEVVRLFNSKDFVIVVDENKAPTSVVTQLQVLEYIS
eukprot:TRINITY_DN10346_c0_g1_i1.p1 TRINITY_DN10346_c0_g1~~TRINITY_DN10346_c0_g1_i1.p1  ORF type:complete len:487 (+),score=160.07 TRINITY_DN10346_c0_g1_i1:35-1495(+)